MLESVFPMKTRTPLHRASRISRLPALLLSVAVSWAACSAGFTADEQEKKPETRPESKIDYQEIDSGTQARIDLGLKWLATQQNQDGTFGSQYRAAVTSLAGIAFLASGSVPNRGPWAKEVRGAQEYILRLQDKQGLITDDRMYTHGFATLFLAELYGMTPSTHNKERVRRALAKAVGVLERIQLDSGGWWYQPNRNYDNSDISVTICEIMALRAARNAGITVKPECVAKARRCVKAAYYKDGGFAYRVFNDGRKSGGHAFPRSAAGVCILYYLGDSDAPEVRGGIDYILARKPGTNAGKNDHYYEAFYFYGVYYATQAMYQAGGRYWEEWFPALRKDLLRRQDTSTGAWHHWRGHVRNSHYATAMALITLQLPNRYLPILQR